MAMTKEQQIRELELTRDEMDWDEWIASVAMEPPEREDGEEDYSPEDEELPPFGTKEWDDAVGKNDPE